MDSGIRLESCDLYYSLSLVDTSSVNAKGSGSVSKVESLGRYHLTTENIK